MADAKPLTVEEAQLIAEHVPGLLATIEEQRQEISRLWLLIHEAHGWLRAYGFEDGPGIFNGLMGRMKKLVDATDGHNDETV